MALSKEQIERIESVLRDEWVTEDEDESLRRLRGILKAIKDPEELHQLAANLNWDTGVSHIAEVIRHPALDRGTALLIFWLGGPGWHYRYASRDEVPKDERATYDLLKEIEKRYVSDQFRSRAIRVDPSNIRGENYLELYKTKGGLQKVPEVMRRPSPGKDVAILDLPRE